MSGVGLDGVCRVGGVVGLVEGGYGCGRDIKQRQYNSFIPFPPPPNIRPWYF